MSSALKLSAQCNKLEQDISLSLSWRAVTALSPSPVHKSNQMASGSGHYFSHSYDRVSGKLPAEISVSQDSSQRSLRVNCQSQTFLHCPGSFDRVQCLMPGSGFMMARWKPFDHWLHCVRDPKPHQDKLNLMISDPVYFISSDPWPASTRLVGTDVVVQSKSSTKAPIWNFSTFSLGPPLTCLTLRKNLFQFSWRN